MASPPGGLVGNNVPAGDAGIMDRGQADEFQPTGEVQTSTAVSHFRTTGLTICLLILVTPVNRPLHQYTRHRRTTMPSPSRMFCPYMLNPRPD